MNRIRLTVNGREVEADVSPRTHLADFLREQLLLTGTHIGCEHGICGACTVEIDGEIARSCITYAVACDGASVRTIEGFDEDPLMGRMRAAFTQNHALQCGYCTPGMLISARDLVRRKQGLDRAQIRAEMSGNLCRCTGYMGIVNAIEGVMKTGASEVAATPASATAARAWLGPAPGPQASTASATPAPARPAAQPARRSSPAAAPKSNRRAIAVSVGAVETVDGATRLTQSFTLPHPRDAVWAMMSDIQSVSACMPGLFVDEARPDGTMPGRFEIALGPIKASFAGLGTIETHAAEGRQVISGRGGDKRSGSQASGSVDYRLTAEGVDATRVDVAIAYVLSGPLAQVGRSAIVRDVVRRLGEAFAKNIDARLSGETPQAQAAISVVDLMLQVVVGRVRAIWNAIMGRRG